MTQDIRPLSAVIFERSCEVIPSGVNSPVRSFRNVGIPPLIVKSGYRDVITDVDGNHYVDFCGSWGALIHGHAPPSIVEAVQKRVALGTTFGIATAEEERLAHLMVKELKVVEKIRFVSSGTESVMSAIRLSRGFTGKELIIKFSGHYHGHVDALLVEAGSGVAHLNQSSSSKGVPDDVVKKTLVLPFNDFERCLEAFRTSSISENLAAVIVEPIAANMGVVLSRPGFLEMLRAETIKCGALLIFDEVITGFRVGLKGASGLYNISPDLSCFGKILGGGFPAAAFGGRKEIMDHLAPEGEVYQAGTLSGNPVAMEAGYHTLKLLERPLFYKRLEEKTQTLTQPIQEVIKRKNMNATLTQIGSMFTLFFGVKQMQCFEEGKKLDLTLWRKFFCALFDQGIYLPPSQFEASFVSSAHSDEHLIKTRDAILEFLESSL